MTSQRLTGKTAFITAAGQGIGRATAELFASEGAVVWATDMNAGLLENLSGCRTRHLDVTDPGEIAAALSEAGPVDILFNCAGYVHAGTILDCDDDAWNLSVGINVTSMYRLIRAALPGMLERGFGRIVNIASTSGLRGYPYVAAYCAAKHGVIGLTRALALEVAQRGVTVNAVCPGFTETALVEDAIANIRKVTGRSAEAAREALTRTNPQGRLIEPAEVAHTVAWLCLPGSESVTGQSIAVAGGEVM